MEKTSNERFFDILNDLDIELRKAESGGYFIYDRSLDVYYPYWEEVVASEEMALGSKDAGHDLSIERGENGVYRIVYKGDNADYATLFNAAPEKRATKLLPLAEKCDLDIDEINDFMTVSWADDVAKRIEFIVVGSCVQDIDECTTSLLYERAPESYGDIIKFENHLEEIITLGGRLEELKSAGDNAKNILARCKQDFENVHFLDNVGYTYLGIHLDNVYELQESSKQTQEKTAPKVKATVERD